jgi:hydroxylamine dehydrogenase
MRSPLTVLILVPLALLAAPPCAHAQAAPTTQSLPPKLTEASAACVECHTSEMPGLVMEWRQSRHFAAKVGCYECHAAQAADAEAMDHNGYLISVIVSPRDCAKCHPIPAAEFGGSHHADAGAILGSLDNMLGEVVEGPLAAATGCKQCHGAVVKVNADKTLDPLTWPNTGIGRINPDGSKGSCAACHSRHSFDASLARQPENCGKCHLGPDHPQKEIYEESKHGIAYYANIPRMNLHSASWVVGADYSAAPTCATCHISATKDLPMSHDVGGRISWTLRPAVSQKIDASAIRAGRAVKTWEARRTDMKKVCSSCHTSTFIGNFYAQYDGLVGLYNTKFAEPATAIYTKLREAGILTADTDFDEELEWTYYYLWHHEGRRTRMGTAMFAPDYTQWHGMYEVAERFYMEFIPQVGEAVKRGRAAGGAKAAAAVEVEKMVIATLDKPEHAWFQGKEPAEVKAARKKAAEEFRKRYAP